MLIGELADIAGVTCQTVRFYERRGLLPDAERGAPRYTTPWRHLPGDRLSNPNPSS